MILAALILYGLALGSFVNALVWRVHEQAGERGKKRPSKTRLERLSIRKGRSMCPHCRHELGVTDLVPVLSWLWLRGKCRYCKAPIAIQYPLVELFTAVLFIVSYLWWPEHIAGLEIGVFILWLGLLTGFMALIVYDLRWMLLPNRIVYPLTVLATTQAVLRITEADSPLKAIVAVVLSVAIGSGIFYLLFQISGGRWIGGGDVKLGWVLGLSLGKPELAVLCIFLASLIGLIFSVPPLVRGAKSKGHLIPFGPFLISGAVISQLFGTGLIHWYAQVLLGL